MSRLILARHRVFHLLHMCATSLTHHTSLNRVLYTLILQQIPFNPHTHTRPVQCTQRELLFSALSLRSYALKWCKPKMMTMMLSLAMHMSIRWVIQGSCPFDKIKLKRLFKDFQGPYEGYIRRTKLKQTGTFISISRQNGPLKSSYGSGGAL